MKLYFLTNKTLFGINVFRITLFACVFFSSASCSWYESAKFHRQLENSRKVALLKIDKDKCSQENGKIEGVGMFGTPSCVHYYSDAGKYCIDKNDCQGYCMGGEYLNIGEASTGTCQKSEQDQFGCFTIINNGKVSNAMCQD